MIQLRLPFVAALLMAAGAVAPDARQNPVRDAPMPPPATSSIAGVVTSDDDGRAPVRRAVISVRGEKWGELVVTTDESGHFVVAPLPPDRYTISASKPAYLTAVYSAKGTKGATALVLGPDEHATMALVMKHAGAIAGTVIGTNGLPAAGVQVTAMKPTLYGGERILLSNASAPAQYADDQGRFRIWGLTPGNYVVVVKPGPTMPRGLAMLGADADAPDRLVTFAPVYWPGTADVQNAGHIDIAAGQEVNGLTIPFQLVPAATVDGVVQTEDAGALPPGLRLMLSQVTAGVAPLPTTEFVTPDSTGRFSVAALPPGRYVLRLYNATAIGAAPTDNRGYWTQTEFELNGAPLRNLAVTLRRGVTLKGTIVFEESEGAQPPSAMVVTVYLEALATNGVKPGNAPATKATADGTFTIAGLAPGRYRVSPSFQLLAEPTVGWYLKAVSLDGAVLREEVVQIGLGTAAPRLQIAYSRKPSELSGRLIVDDGAPAPGYYVLVFPRDEALWTPQTRRVQYVRPSSDGQFTIRNLPADEYLLCALDELSSTDLADPGFLRALTRSAVRFQIGDGEKVAMTLRPVRVPNPSRR